MVEQQRRHTERGRERHDDGEHQQDRCDDRPQEHDEHQQHHERDHRNDQRAVAGSGVLGVEIDRGGSTDQRIGTGHRVHGVAETFDGLLGVE